MRHQMQFHQRLSGILKALHNVRAVSAGELKTAESGRKSDGAQGGILRARDKDLRIRSKGQSGISSGARGVAGHGVRLFAQRRLSRSMATFEPLAFRFVDGWQAVGV